VLRTATPARVAVVLATIALTACGAATPAPRSLPGAGSAPPTTGVAAAATSSSARPATPRPYTPRTATPRPAGTPAAPGAPEAPGAQGLLAAGEASGRRPQTAGRPSPDARWNARVRALWSAVSGGPAADARAAFFPRSAYLQVKALADPAADYARRLLRLYAVDVAAVAARIPPGSMLIGAVIPPGAVWVRPGEEVNRLGYWRVAGTRVRYRTPMGKVDSFGVCSLISWRSEWYVVHLGPVLRSTPGGALCP